MKKITVLGECLIELSQDKDNLYKQAFAGDTINCAIYLKREFPEASIEYITVLGEDKMSKKMIDFFHEEDIKTTHVDFIKNKNPGLYMIETKNGERSFSFWRESSSAKKLFTTKSLKNIKKEMLSSDMIYFSAITIAIMSKKGRDNLFKTLKEAKSKNIKIAYDSNYRPALYKNEKKAIRLHNKALRYCDIFLPSFDDEQDLRKKIEAKDIISNAKKQGIGEIVIKCGKNDIIYYYKDKTKSIKVQALNKIVDSTSAGDSFNGGYLASRLQNNTIEDSIKKAQKLSAKVIMHKGAIIPKEKK